MFRIRLAVALVTGVTILGAISVSSASAQIYIMESSVAAIRVGSALDMGATLSIPAGGQIRAVLPSGKTQTIRGPFDGPVADLAKGQPINEGVALWIRNVLSTGGATESRPGATRSISRPPEKVRVPFSWSAIPLATGTVCVQKGAKLQLVRAGSAAGERFTVVDSATGQQAEGQWGAGSTTADWPTSLAPRTGVTYHVQVPERTRQDVVLRVIDSLPNEDDVLTELQKQGCKSQFEAWVRDKLAAKN
jgi:hypothetical protein